MIKDSNKAAKSPKQIISPHKAQPNWRKPFGMMIILLTGLGVAFLIATQADYIGSLHIAVQTIIYIIVGIGWIFPIRPILRWMESGG
ncbi:hypothetical protein LPB140_07035 [Sphingorhabdus lutea]|uniref:DUF2842 domain-containing protein n=1 Tax=Sphingorhabdus lutea TaxID=1913578 RepID=A0A1L3JBQ7_9SPHN|nr:DUF2842 domain-containing protein [Sphingorhabdus lutea]APG62577.1 hypothetical protein LPB140_07035 [Sphingorhabdus lutea]